MAKLQKTIHIRKYVQYKYQQIGITTFFRYTQEGLGFLWKSQQLGIAYIGEKQ